MQSHIIQFKYAMIRADANAAMYACTVSRTSAHFREVLSFTHQNSEKATEKFKCSVNIWISSHAKQFTACLCTTNKIYKKSTST